MAGLFIIHLTAKSREIAEMQISKTVHSNETEMVAGSVTQAVTAGQLSTILTAEELAGTTSLTLTGTIDARDFKTMRDLMPLLAKIDLSGAKIVEYSGTEGTSIYGKENYQAYTVPENAFSASGGKASLRFIKLPDHTIEIGKEAFLSCNGLNNILLPTSLVTLGERAFGWCSGLNEISFPASIKNIGRYALSTTNISTIYIPENVEFIGQGVLYQCRNLSEITVSPNNQHYCSIDGVLFNKNHTELIQYPNGKTNTNYFLPVGVQKIQAMSFDGGNSYLRNLTISEGVIEIGFWAFANLWNLETIDIPSSIIVISEGAFIGQHNYLQSITIRKNKPVTISSDVFGDVNKSTCVLYVPFGTKTDYQNANVWKDFQSIVEMEPKEELTYVPDNNFEQALIDLGYDSGELDNFVPTAKISTLISLDVSGKGIEDLTGIEDFASLQTLNCSGNHLSTLILNKNLNLYGLDCGNNRISNLDVSTCTHLTNLQGYNNLISSLDLSNCVNLITIDVQTNQLTNIDISNNQKLVWLNLGNNPLTKLDITKNNELEALFCSNFQFTSIDLSQNINLISLGLYSGSLTALDVSKNQNLKVLWCHNNSLEHIDASKNTALTTLSCQNNQLTYLNVQNGNNSNMVADETGLNASGNPELYCIQVDNPLLAATYTNWTKDAHASYSSNCSPMPVVNYPSDADIVLNNGQTFNITWSDFSGTRVKIELMKKNRVAATIVASTPNDGSHPYTIPASLQSGDDYRIMITSLEDRTVYDISDNFFAVQTLANPMVLVPSEPDIIWNNSKTYNILWSEYSGSKVRIELLKGNLVRSTIAASTANDGTHPWTIAKNLESGTDYKIRITSVENNSVTDISDHDFTIQPNTDKPGKKSAGIEFNTLSNHGESLLVFPNPFTHKVNFEIILKKSAPVVLEIFTVTGLKLSTLFDGFVDAGVTTRFEYQPEKIQAQILLYRLRIGDESETGKLIYKP